MTKTASPAQHLTLQRLHWRFQYTPDKGRLDHWRITRHSGLVLDDCDGFALTLLYTLADKKLWRFWWLLVTFQACFWHVTTARGAGHLVLWYRGMWADNTMSDWYVTSDMPHTRRFPWPWPAVALKLLIGKPKPPELYFCN